MNEDLKFIIDSAKEAMDNAITHLGKRLLTIRAGKASPAMLQGLMVDYYGSPTPLSQVANVVAPDGRTISIQPWEKSIIQEIEKAIINGNLGFNPMNNGESVIINVPPLTEERRKELVDSASEDEKANAEVDIQKLTDIHIKKIEEVLANKETEIMTV